MPVSIRSRLLLLVLSALLPGVAGALWLIGQTYMAERDGNERNLRDTAQAMAMVIERELDQRATVARVLALSRALDAGPALGPDQLALFASQARRALAGMEGWIELSDGTRVLLDTRGPVAGAIGAGAAAGPGPPAVQGMVERPVFNPVQLPSGGSAHAAVTYPVQRDGRTVLNLTVTILPGELQTIIDAQRLPPDRIGTLLDNGGTVVARHPEGGRGNGADAGRPAAAELLAQLATQASGRLQPTRLDGVPSVGYFSRSAQGWTYISAMPQAVLRERIPLAVLQVSAASLLLLGLAALGAVWVSRRIAGPMIALKDDAARLQGGAPLARRATGIVECDEVAAALADAATAIAGARADLERQIGDAVARTRAAEQRGAQSQRVEALGRLTGGVAHDFNNLLGVISNSAHLIERHATQPETQAPLAATLRAVEVGSRLTRHLLRFAGLQQVRPQLLQLDRFLPELAELLRSVLGKRVALAVSVAAGTPAVAVDVSELELALVNLALNARDALPAGGQVRLQAAQAGSGDTDGLRPGPWVRIDFSDDGAGIQPQHASRAFEPFFTTKPAGTGTGLGLSQVHGFCVQAGGTARLGSTPGLGTTVSLLLPAATGAAAAAAELPAVAAPVASPGTGLAGARVLLVEDNHELADVTAALLLSYGCQVLRAADADAALGLLQTAAPLVDAVLSDIVMPGSMDGVALARLLREQQPQLPVVLMSGYSSTLAASDGFVLLHKPYSQQALLDALLAALSGRPAAAGASPLPGAVAALAAVAAAAADHGGH